jgi:hypothetical protein
VHRPSTRIEHATTAPAPSAASASRTLHAPASSVLAASSPHRRRGLLIALSLTATLALGCEGTFIGDDGGGRDAPRSLDGGEALDGSPSIDASAPGDGGPPTCGCFAGDGEYCAGDVAAHASAEGCGVPGLAAAGDRLLSCAAGTWTIGEVCVAGCELGETGASAGCSLPECDCFVRASWCGASAARHGLTLDPPCRVPLVPEHDDDLLGCDGARWIVLEDCAEGCSEMATGTPDACVSRATPEDPGWDACPHRALLRAGLHPEASDRLRCAGVTADRITQTIGDAAASAGYHAADGTADGLAYTAAVDLRTRDLTTTQIRELLDRLGRNGFAAWYRQPGSDGWPASEAPHIHAVFAGVVMKSALRSQVRDFLDGRNGLTSHTVYRFWPPPAAIREIVRLLFSRHYTP